MVGRVLRHPVTRALALGVTLVGCGDDHHGDDDADDGHDEGGGSAVQPAAVVACDHYEFGPSVETTVSAAADPAPAIEPHTRVDLALEGEGTQRGGRLRYRSVGSGEAHLFLDRDVPVEPLDAQGQRVAARTTTRPVEDCDRAAVQYDFELQAGEYELVIGPTEEPEASVVVHVPPPEAEHHGEHGEAVVPAEFRDLMNPVAGDPDAIAAGQSLYEANCAACHGADGGGDGPAAAGETPPPTDLTASSSAEWTDGYLYWRLAEGRRAEGNPSTMPAFDELLSEEQRWQVIAYLRTLAD